MNLSLPSASQLIVRFGAKQLTELAVPRDQYVIDAELLTAAAGGDDVDAWPAEDVAIAVKALARIADAVTRARSEISFYLRFRKAGQDAPAWVADDLMELARYHLVDDAGKEESTVRARYKDVLKRLETLAKEDESRGASEAGDSGLTLRSQPRMFNRNTLRSL
ncbi:Mu-like prophage protein gp36 [Pseudomonas flavescens]|uniref:Mu-like prophage protein gp36 n=1 Tax=Phytopseudomonas flavescens TaxID=29435 RepID=A0A1G8NTN8_9GAMM|nr:phage protein Gp36 family protein [Pseudomonas flavescens]SDI83527.1 Mu-like prophage protein gp36 [Pseudomonas flavescens]